jgi:hypothetical protein
VLLDYSSSMNSYTTELAQVGFATKRACQNLGIPCTVTLWDDAATVLYDANEFAETMPTIATNGSTNPDTALADLDNQRQDKEHHIVIIMTDGDGDSEWDNKKERTLVQYGAQGRYLIGFGYDGRSNASASRLADKLIAKGCPEAYGITDLMEIPRKLESALLAFV